jgi:hypothetical protein
MKNEPCSADVGAVKIKLFENSEIDLLGNESC